jgi:polyhydroxybutyrate depolymerase
VCARAGSFEASAVIDGTARSLLVERPATAASPAVLVIALHGAGALPNAMITQTALTEPAEALGFVVVYPAALDREWGILLDGERFPPDAHFLAAIVDTLAAGGCVDPDRVVLAGFSLGGIFAHNLACTDTTRFHTVVAVAARDVGEPCAPTRPVTFIGYSGVLDNVIPYEGGPRLGWELSSAEGWAADWAARNGCTQSEPAIDSNERVLRREWTGGCGAPVVLYSITEGYHVWPGGDPPIGGLADEDTDPTETVLRLVAGEAP